MSKIQPCHTQQHTYVKFKDKDALISVVHSQIFCQQFGDFSFFFGIVGNQRKQLTFNCKSNYFIGFKDYGH